MFCVRTTALQNGLKLPITYCGSIFRATWPASLESWRVTPSRVCIYTVYFINRQGLGPTLSPRLESAFAWTAIVWSHSLRYISPRFLSYSTSCVSLTLQPEWRRIPAATRAARTMPLPFMDRLEYRCSNGNVTCKGRLTANYNLFDYVTRDRVSVNRSTSYSLVNVD